MKTINEWATAVHGNSRAKGWWDGVNVHAPGVIPEKLCLIHSEVSEALEVYRETAGELAASRYAVDTLGISQFRANEDGTPRKPVGFDSELADVVIRVLDLAEALGINMERAIAEKHAYNQTRAQRHGGKRC